MNTSLTSAQTTGPQSPPAQFFDNPTIASSWIQSVLRNPFVDPALDDYAAALLEESSLKDSPPHIVGGLNFIRFTLGAELYRFEPIQSHLDTANTFLAQCTCIAFIKNKYNYDFHNLTESQICDNRLLSLYRVGTTSFILRFQDTFALKIIKAHYLDDPNISDATLRYKDEYRQLYGNPAIVPEVYQSTRQFIEMRFISGATLREYAARLSNTAEGHQSRPHGARTWFDHFVRKYIWKLEEDTAREIPAVEKIVSVAQGVCTLLSGASAQKKHHFDLSPDNVLIELDQDEHPVRVWLIDLGFNYLLYERLGSPSAFVHAQKYMAPELFRGPRKNEIVSGVSCDLYSLGVILLELLSRRDLHPRDIPYHLDKIWMNKPDFGSVIEQMMHHDPRMRTGRTYRKPEKVYNLVSERLQYAQEMFRSSGDTSVTFKGGIVRALFPMNNVHAIFELRRRQAAATKPIIGGRKVDVVAKTGEATISNMFWWSRVALIVSLATSLISLLFILEDLGIMEKIHHLHLWDVPLLGPLVGVSEHINEWIGGTWQSRLPGRIVGLSFCIVATQYYFNILSLIPSLGLDLKTRFWMRANAFSFAIPILYAVVVCPSAWPVCSAIGVFVVFLNNHYCYLAAAEIRDRLFSGKERGRSSRVDDFLEQFDKWRSGILLYAITLSLLQILFLTEELFGWTYFEDEWVYALAVTFPVNLVFLHFDASTRQAPMVRSGLRRLFSSNVNFASRARVRAKS